MIFDKKLTNEEKLDLIYQMTKENHEALRSLKRQQYVANAFRVLYWLVILGALGGVYYYISPMLGYVTDNSSKIFQALESLQHLQQATPENEVLHGLIDGLKKSATGGQ
jgi:hypothetical protein